MWRRLREVWAVLKAASAVYRVVTFLSFAFGGLAATIVTKLVGLGWVWMALTGLAGACFVLAVFLIWLTERQKKPRHDVQRTVGDFISEGVALMVRCGQQTNDINADVLTLRADAWSGTVQAWLHDNAPAYEGVYASDVVGFTQFSGSGPRERVNGVRNFLERRVAQLTNIQMKL